MEDRVFEPRRIPPETRNEHYHPLDVWQNENELYGDEWLLFTPGAKRSVVVSTVTWHLIDWGYLFYFGNDHELFYWLNIMVFSDSIIEALMFVVFLAWIIMVSHRPFDIFPQYHILDETVALAMYLLRLFWNYLFLGFHVQYGFLSIDGPHDGGDHYEPSIPMDLNDSSKLLATKDSQLNMFYFFYCALSLVSTIIWTCSLFRSISYACNSNYHNS